MKLYAICLGLCLLTTSSHAEPKDDERVTKGSGCIQD